MPAVQSKLAFEALRSRAASTFTGSYQTLGAVMAHPIRVFKITNDTSVGVTVSYDGGVTDHEYLPSETFLLIDVTSNRDWDCLFALAQGVQVDVKGAAGTGTIYLSTYYAA